MKYLDYGDTRIIVSDKLSYDVLSYPGIGHSINIKVVSKKVSFPYSSIVHIIDKISGQNIRFFHNSKTSAYNFGVCVVFCFDYDKYFYLLYDATLYSQIGLYLENNIFSSDCLELTGTFAAPRINEEKCPHLNYQEQDVLEADFPNATGYNLQIIKRYSVYEQTEEKKSSGKLATCSCGYVSEFVEDYPGYKCPQCKIWNSILI